MVPPHACSSSTERWDSAEIPFLQQRASTKFFFFFCTLLMIVHDRQHGIGDLWYWPIALATALIVCPPKALWWFGQVLKVFLSVRFVIWQKELSALRHAQMVTATTSGSAEVLWFLFRRSIITSIIILTYGRQFHFKFTEMLHLPVLTSYIEMCASGLWWEPPLATTAAASTTAGSPSSQTGFPPWALALCILGRLVVFVGYYLVNQVSVDQEAQQPTKARAGEQQKGEQQQTHQACVADSGRTYNYASLNYNISCVGIALFVFHSVANRQFMTALGATDMYDQPWLSLAVAALTGGAAAAVASPDFKLTTTFTMWYSLLTSGLCIAATTARAHSLLLTWDEIAASVIPQSASLAVAAVGLLLLPKSWRRRRSRWYGGHLMLAAFPCGVALQCAYSMITSGGDPTIVSDIHLAAHATGYTDLVCATALSGWTVAVLSGASLARTGGQLLFSVVFFLVIALGHAPQFLIMVTAAVHLLLLTFRMILANRGGGMLGGITNAVQFDDDVDAGLISAADAAKFV